MKKIIMQLDTLACPSCMQKNRTCGFSTAWGKQYESFV